MTVRVTTLKGADAGAYYVDALPNYYTQTGELRGAWIGDGAQALGLAGDVTDDAFLAVMAGMDPRQPDRHMGRRFGDKSARGFDVTCSAPKSVSVLFALGDLDDRREVLAAHDAAVSALAAWVERLAHTRFRVGGQVAIVDADGIVAAAFRQHTSRALDPQLHTHLVIANRVRSPDGRWLALDARLIKREQRSLSAIYHAALRGELTRRLGVRWETPESGIAEMSDVPAFVLAEFSSRTADVLRRVDAKLDRFVETIGREPTPRERWRLEREAVVDTRPNKAHALDAAVLHDQWMDQVRRLGYEPTRVVADAVDKVIPRDGPDAAELEDVIDRAVAAMSEQQSSWRPTEVYRALGPAIPTDIGIGAVRLVEQLDILATHLVAARCVELSPPVPSGALTRRDGRPVSESAVDRALSTQAILDQESELIGWAERRLEHNGRDEPVAIGDEATLDAQQVQAAAAVAGYDELVLVVGPAGAGKTTALAPAVATMQGIGRRVFGVAPSANAADVLARNIGIAADTLDKLLIEHSLPRLPGWRYELPSRATVIVDEAGMIPTTKLEQLARLADTKGWRVVLVGDPLQFSAVGRGGMFGRLVDTFGAVELERVHRFDHQWERDAGLRLRRGDVDVATLYDANGRLRGGTHNEMERAAVARWRELRQSGQTVLLMTPTNEATERLNIRCQQTRIRDGELDPTGAHVEAGAYMLWVGDEIATRQNDRRLTTDTGEMVRNRATWTITAIGHDGSLTATGRHGTIQLPPTYVSDHVELGYARTGMAGQGRTVNAGLLFLERATDVRNLYVPMTRGTDTNEAFIVTSGEETAVDVFARSIGTDWIDQPAHTRHDELNNITPHHPSVLDAATLRELIEERHGILLSIRRAQNTIHHTPHYRQAARRELADAERHSACVGAQLTSARLVLEQFDRPLSRRRHAAEIEQAKHDLVRLPGTQTFARARVDAAAARLRHVERAAAEADEFLDHAAALDERVDDIDAALAADRRGRSRAARLQQPTVVVEVLGCRPAAGTDAQAWDAAAGYLLQHQAAFDVGAGLGPQPDLFEESAYASSRSDIVRHLESLSTADRPEQSIELDQPGIEM